MFTNGLVLTKGFYFLARSFSLKLDPSPGIGASYEVTIKNP